MELSVITPVRKIEEIAIEDMNGNQRNGYK
jgi:hypothetical protein